VSSLVSSNQVLIAPLVTEKTTLSGERENSVSFWVHAKATKLQIKHAVENYFPKVKVATVRTSIKGREATRFGQKPGTTVKRKKAYVTLAKGHEIDFAEFE
jgi:large subunit ribosomal protein L23